MIPQYQSVTGAPAQPPPAVNENIQGSDLRPKHSVVQGGHHVFFSGLRDGFQVDQTAARATESGQTRGNFSSRNKNKNNNNDRAKTSALFLFSFLASVFQSDIVNNIIKINSLPRIETKLNQAKFHWISLQTSSEYIRSVLIKTTNHFKCELLRIKLYTT